MAIERLFIGEGVKEAEVKRYLNKELKRAGLADIVIQRTPLVTRIVLYCDRPALVIGRKGKNVKDITTRIEQDFKIEKPELEIKKVDKPNLEPNIVAYRIASALERGMNPRRVGYKALQSILHDGAKGAEIVLSGKLVGKGGRARTLKMRAGYMKKCGRPSIEQVLHGIVTANCKAGVIGIQVAIVPANIHFPDEIQIIRPESFEVEEQIIETSGEVEGTPQAPGEPAAGEVKVNQPAAQKGKPKFAKPKIEGGKAEHAKAGHSGKEHQKTGHPKAEHSGKEHPKAEHAKTEHPKAEHPGKEHSEKKAHAETKEHSVKKEHSESVKEKAPETAQSPAGEESNN